MTTIHIKRGLNVPIAGAFDSNIVDGPSITKVALLAHDYPGLKPTMHVKAGDKVKIG